MADVLRVNDSLNCHHGSMNDAGPDSKPDQAAVREGVTRSTHEEYTKCGGNRENHLQIFRLSSMPCPTRRPNNRERINPKQKNQTYLKQSGSQLFNAMDVSHDLLLRDRSGSKECGVNQ